MFGVRAGWFALLAQSGVICWVLVLADFLLNSLSKFPEPLLNCAALLFTSAPVIGWHTVK